LEHNLHETPNQIANDGVSINSENSSHDIFSGTQIATFPRNATRGLNNEQGERAASLLRRVGSNRPVYKPQYWEMVKEFDQNANEEDPSNNSMPGGIPRGDTPLY